MNKRELTPAFPMSTVDGYAQIGMTLRDYFAAAALQGLIAGVKNDATAHMKVLSHGGPIDRSNYSFTAYEYADAMLKEREE